MIQRIAGGLIRQQWSLLLLLFLFPVQASVARLQPRFVGVG
jgi:hypothetical protein